MTPRTNKRLPTKKRPSVKTPRRGVSAQRKPKKATTDHPSEALARLLTAAMGDDAVEVEWVEDEKQ